MRVTNERVKELMQSNTVTISSIADRRELCHDLLEARELIKEMCGVIINIKEDELSIQPDIIPDLLDRTKDYS